MFSVPVASTRLGAYRPPMVFRPKPAHRLDHQPGKIVVMDLARGITRHDLEIYFSSFGSVWSVAVKSKPTKVYAFVTFDSDDAVAAAVDPSRRHAICGTPVRVLRAFRSPLPSRPFPCMDPVTSPLRQAMRQYALLHDDTSTRAQQQDATEDFRRTGVFRAIARLWPCDAL